MHEFAEMIYNQWRNKEEENMDWGDYYEIVSRIYDFLNEKIAQELECAINTRVWKVEENAFIAGFSYACKCLSDGKIELKSNNKGDRHE
ncbi:MAG: hypothetical protein K2P35_14735 [Lachnospiraceae bacterium]|nr:hypothetical protein [Lachnospiraceae bacterium]